MKAMAHRRNGNDAVPDPPSSTSRRRTDGGGGRPAHLAFLLATTILGCSLLGPTDAFGGVSSSSVGTKRGIARPGCALREAHPWRHATPIIADVVCANERRRANQARASVVRLEAASVSANDDREDEAGDGDGDGDGCHPERRKRLPALLRRIGKSIATLPLPGIRRKVGRAVRPASLALLTSLALNLEGPGTSHHSHHQASMSSSLLRPPAAHARLPIDAVQDTNLDVREIGMRRATKERDAKRQAESLAHRAQCDKIEVTKGTKARKQYEAQYQAKREAAKAAKATERTQLLNRLLDEGICPFTDTEGIRQVYLHDEDIDLAKVEGTEQYYDFVETMAGKRSAARVTAKYELPRFIVKAQVADLRVHNQDPIHYFETNQPKTAKLFDMPQRQLKQIADQYKERIAEYGSLNPVTRQNKRGEPEAETVSDAEAHKANDEALSKREARVAERTARREAKAKARADAVQAKADARAAKEQARAEARAERVKVREDRAAAKLERRNSKRNAVDAAKGATAAAAAVAAHAAADAETAATAGMDMMATAGQEAVMPSHMDSDGEGSVLGTVAGEGDSGGGEGGAATATATAPATGSGGKGVAVGRKKLPIVPAAAVVGVAGGSYVFKVSRDRAAAEEEERQRQFKLIMGVTDDDEDDDDDDDDEAGGGFGGASSDFPSLMDSPKSEPAKKKAESSSSPPPPPPPAPAKKRFGGIKSVFAKKPGRENDLNVLLAPDAKAPGFTALLAKVLTFGAPGRFPHVTALPGGMPMEEYDLEKARELLGEEKDAAGLSDQDAAEAFACVVNCMIIDIIDLASSTLGEKEDKPTADAMNIVMDFMDHAAGLFEPFLTEGVSIKPVTYGGTLGKGKLEQLYTTYATAIMSEAGVTEERIDMFRELFEIKEKKAEGLVQKKMMANLFKMMKDPDAMQDMMGGEGMEEMMAAMGGLEGMPGMDEELSPEQLKESVNMMKELVESGSVSKEEMNLVKEQFKQQYGMDMSELIANADSDEVREQLGDDGEELLEMFKIILKATE